MLLVVFVKIVVYEQKVCGGGCGLGYGMCAWSFSEDPPTLLAAFGWLHRHFPKYSITKSS